MKNKKRNKIFLLLILLLGIGVGFAALATTLKINGSTIIGKNSWNIYWDNIDNQDGVTPTTSEIVDEDATHKNNIVNFTVTFNQPGDYYEFTVDAVNAGTLDAEILSIEKKYNDTVIPEEEDPNNRVVPAYLKYEVKYADDTLPAIGDGLAKAQDLTSTPPVYTTKTYKIRVEYDRNAVTNADINNQVGNVTHEFSFKVDYGQATPAAGPAGPVAFATDSWDTIAAEGNRAATQTSVDSNLTCGVYHVGDTKTIQFDLDGDNTPEDYVVRIANCSTPAVCSTEGFSQTSCGFVVEFQDALFQNVVETYMMNLGGGGSVDSTGNKGSWPATNLRAFMNNGMYSLSGFEKDYTNTGLLTKLPSDLTTQIANTTVVSGHGKTNDSNNFTSTDKLFLLAAHEVYEYDEIYDTTDQNDVTYHTGIKYNATDFDNTRQLDYYRNLNVTDEKSNKESFAGAKKKNILTGEYDEWWLRSPRNSANDLFYNASWEGMCDYNYAVTNNSGMPSIGISPAFKLK